MNSRVRLPTGDPASTLGLEEDQIGKRVETMKTTSNLVEVRNYLCSLSDSTNINKISTQELKLHV